MPSNVNSVIVSGNITRDPELRYTSAGTACATIGIAVNNAFRDKKGELRESVVFLDVDMFARQAEIAGEFLHKGSAVLIEGRLQLDQWEDKNSGEPRSKLKVICNKLHFLDKKPAGESNGDVEPCPI